MPHKVLSQEAGAGVIVVTPSAAGEVVDCTLPARNLQVLLNTPPYASHGGGIQQHSKRVYEALAEKLTVSNEVRNVLFSAGVLIEWVGDQYRSLVVTLD